MGYEPERIVDKVLQGDEAMRIVGEEEEEATVGQEKPSAEASQQPVANEATPAQPEPMPSLEQAVPHFATGDIVEGTVVLVDGENVVVDIGGKSEGVLPLSEFRLPGPHAAAPEVNPGDKVEVFVVRVDDETGSLRLSKKRADYEKAWKRIQQAKETGEHLTAVVTERVRGGVRVDLGVPGFVPASHSGYRNPMVLERVVGSTIRVKVIEADKRSNKVILSRRLAAQEERRQQREHMYATLEEGQIVKGVVRSITHYGAFLDIGGVDGLLHISEMSWTRVNDPSEVVKKDEEIEVMVLKVDREKRRISLGLRQITPDPWQDLARQVEKGSILRVKVSRLAARAAFVRLPNRIEGIIPVTELDFRRVNNPAEVVQVGDEFDAKVLNIIPSERRITLSKRAAEERLTGTEVRTFFGDAPPQPVTLGDLHPEVLGAALDSAVERTQAQVEAPRSETTPATDTSKTLEVEPASAEEETGQ